MGLRPPYVGVTKSTTGATETTGTLSSPSLMRMTLPSVRQTDSCLAAAIASLATSRGIRSGRPLPRKTSSPRFRARRRRRVTGRGYVSGGELEDLRARGSVFRPRAELYSTMSRPTPGRRHEELPARSLGQVYAHAFGHPHGRCDYFAPPKRSIGQAPKGMSTCHSPASKTSPFRSTASALAKVKSRRTFRSRRGSAARMDVRHPLVGAHRW